MIKIPAQGELKIMNELGMKIRELRLSLGMSQEELGAKIGVKKAAIHKYESGLVVNLKRETIDKLANALDTTPAYLMGWDKNANAQAQDIPVALSIPKGYDKLTEEERAQIDSLIEMFNRNKK